MGPLIILRDHTSKQGFKRDHTSKRVPIVFYILLNTLWGESEKYARKIGQKMLKNAK